MYVESLSLLSRIYHQCSLLKASFCLGKQQGRFIGVAPADPREGGYYSRRPDIQQLGTEEVTLPRRDFNSTSPRIYLLWHYIYIHTYTHNILLLRMHIDYIHYIYIYSHSHDYFYHDHYEYYCYDHCLSWLLLLLAILIYYHFDILLAKSLKMVILPTNNSFYLSFSRLNQ